MGRLEYQKNYEYLINSFSNSEFKIVIYGSGSLLNDLKKQAEEKNTNVEESNREKIQELASVHAENQSPNNKRDISEPSTSDSVKVENKPEPVSSSSNVKVKASPSAIFFFFLFIYINWASITKNENIK